MYYHIALAHRKEIKMHITKQKVKRAAIKTWWMLVITLNVVLIVPVLLAWLFNYYGAFNALIDAICRACGY